MMSDRTQSRRKKLFRSDLTYKYSKECQLGSHEFNVEVTLDAEGLKIVASCSSFKANKIIEVERQEALSMLKRTCHNRLENVF